MKKLSLPFALDQLRSHYPDVKCELVAQTPFQLLVATVLSAQCTDVRVNQVTAKLFAQFPDPKSLAGAPLRTIEKIVHPTGFFRAKAKNIKALSLRLVNEFQGQVPADMDVLTSLPGVGRKTANVVLGNAFQVSSGIVVDTHVARLASRWGWTVEVNPERIEKDLLKKVPEGEWIIFSHRLIHHGRLICKARKPLCHKCFLVDPCPAYGVE